MRIVASLSHGNGVDGTWVMDTGTKCFWSEGREGEIICLLTTGDVTKFCLHKESFHPRPKDDTSEIDALLPVLVAVCDDGPDSSVEFRVMTAEEEAEYAAVVGRYSPILKRYVNSN